MKISEMRVNGIEKPCGFCLEPLSFSWKVSDKGSGGKQKAARIEIYDQEEKIYSSGQETRADSRDFRVEPECLRLQPGRRYRWTVSVTAENGQTGKGESWFETGKMNEPWKASWITPEAERNAAVAVRTFRLAEPPAKARLYICGLGIYEAYLNGQKAGNEFLAPGYHSYDCHLQAQTYDVTDLLQKGTNTLEIALGQGWFKGRLGFEGGYENLYGDRLYAIAELWDRAKGELLVGTDDTWKAYPSPIIFNNIYDGEVYDARIDRMNSAEEQKTVKREPEGCGPLTDRRSLPVEKKAELPVREVLHTAGGDTVLDFGQNVTGWVEFDLDKELELPAGASLRLTAGEIMQEGEFYHDNYRTARAEYTYISDGQSAHVRPHFTFYGFRYMKLELFDESGKSMEFSLIKDRVWKSHFRAYHLRSGFDRRAELKTGSDLVNRLYSNICWGLADNLLDLPTDCPQRDERLGWTGDAQAISETACLIYDMPAFYRKYLWDMRAEQALLDGSVPNVVPRIKRDMIGEAGSCPWADAGVIIPWNVYRMYGSRSLLEEAYPGMKAWVDYQYRKENALGGPHLVKDGFHFADWLSLDNQEPGPFGATDPLYIASAYYYRCTAITAEAAGILGYPEAKKYRELAAQIYQAIREKYFNTEGQCLIPTQTANALAIMFGLNVKRNTLNGPDLLGARTEADGPALQSGENLNKLVMDKGGHLDTGFVGTPILCPALTETGHGQTALDLLLKEDFPSWLYSVKLGATTIWERWNSVLPDGSMNPEGMNSLNHYTLGSIGAWMIQYLAGIRPAEPGFVRAILQPLPDQRLGFCRCSLKTASGIYRSEWRYEGETVRYHFEIPFGAEAEIRLPGTEPLKAGSGTYVF